MALGFKTATLVEALKQRPMLSVQALHLRQIPSPWRPRSSLPPRSEPGGARRSAACAMAMAAMAATAGGATAMGRQPKEADTETADLRDDELAQDLPGFVRQICRELQQKRPQ